MRPSNIDIHASEMNKICPRNFHWSSNSNYHLCLNQTTVIDCNVCYQPFRHFSPKEVGDSYSALPHQHGLLQRISMPDVGIRVACKKGVCFHHGNF
uniref:Fe2OG dioxygenase domain-containing protein n=1 Tax=Parascaris univalens TaxID=6257 RepID=A0A914ZS98_PARUN